MTSRPSRRRRRTSLASALFFGVAGALGGPSFFARAQAWADDAPATATATAGAGVVTFEGISFSPREKRIEVEAAFAVTEAFLEYLAVAEGGKVHESLFILACKPEHLQLGLIALGLEPRAEVQFQGEARSLGGPRVAIEAEWKDGGARRRARVEDLLLDVRLGGTMPPVGFAFTGSHFMPNPLARRRGAGADAPREVLAAAATGNAIALYHDPDAILDNPTIAAGDVPIVAPTFGMIEIVTFIPGDERYRADRAKCPARGTRAKLIITPLGAAPPEGEAVRAPAPPAEGGR